MRIIPTAELEPNQVLGRPVHDPSNMGLLSPGAVLTNPLIDRIKGLDIGSIYIIDDFSNDIIIKEPIGSSCRLETVIRLQKFFGVMNQPKATATQKIFMDSINKFIDDVITDIKSNANMELTLAEYKAFDDQIYNHSVNVAIISLALGMELGLNMLQLNSLGKAALFHDIGKLFIPNNILTKPGKLTQKEWAKVHEYPKKSHDLVRQELGLDRNALIYILQHQERFDGGGYPHNRSGEEIALGAQILAIADVYDAMTSNRPYRKALNPTDALIYIIQNIDKHFEKSVVRAFISCVSVYPTGASVELSNGDIGLVFKNNKDFLIRPIIKLFKDGTYLNLTDKENSQITIKKVMV